MEVVAIGSKEVDPIFSVKYRSEVNIRGTNIHLVCVDVERPDFNPNNPSNVRKVLVQVIAFSCNYRDKAIIVKHALQRNSFASAGVAPFGFFGSDFVARVMSIGAGVTSMRVGDRVIPDCSYPVARDDSAAPGVVTNEASRGWLILDEAKLMVIPHVMPDDIAAGFSIGGQTASSLVRRTVYSDNDRVLLLSGRSNTSQFVSWILRERRMACDLVTTSSWSEEECALVAPCMVKRVEASAAWAKNLPRAFYDVIIDPFFDLHIDSSIDLLRPGGRYITCGYKNQHSSFRDQSDTSLALDLHSIMIKAMVRNVTLAGNCIGYSEDLKSAISLFEASRQAPVPTDRIFTLNAAADFLDRTYNNKSRLGKVIMRYI